MHGAVHDYVVVRTVKGGADMPSGEATDSGPVKNYVTYPYPELTEQPIFPRVLDIGSLDICGSIKEYNFINRGPAWRDIIGCTEFVGLDLMAGNCVDIVANSHDIPLEDESFDLVTCCNMLEHDSDPGQTMKEAYRVAKEGAVVILTTVNQNWDVHPQLGGGDTETFNRITLAQYTKWVHEAGFLDADVQEWNDNLFCYAVKNGGLKVKAEIDKLDSKAKKGKVKK